MVITVEIYKQIRKMRLQGTSQRQIAASLQISRNTVGETTVRRLVSQLREKPQQEAFVPLSFPPGDAMQIDWGEATVYLSRSKDSR